ncbi:hypothetical protein ABK040_006017 [Willaertia magna]
MKQNQSSPSDINHKRLSLEKHQNNVYDQELWKQWNKDLEGIDFSLEPFLKKCKQEREEEERQKIQMENIMLKQVLVRGHPTLFNQPTTFYHNSFNKLEQNNYILYKSCSNYNHNQKPNRRLKTESNIFVNYNNQPSTQTKNLVIHVEHPEKPKEKKKRGRPCKRNEEEETISCSDGNKNYIFISNCFEEKSHHK